MKQAVLPDTGSHKILSYRIRQGRNKHTTPETQWEPHLYDKVTAAEVGDGPGQPRAAPHEAQEEGALRVRQGLHHFPEPLGQRRRRLDPLIRGHRLQKVQRDIRAAAHLWEHTVRLALASSARNGPCFPPGRLGRAGGRPSARAGGPAPRVQVDVRSALRPTLCRAGAARAAGRGRLGRSLHGSCLAAGILRVIMEKAVSRCSEAGVPWSPTRIR